MPATRNALHCCRFLSHRSSSVAALQFRNLVFTELKRSQALGGSSCPEGGQSGRAARRSGSSPARRPGSDPANRWFHFLCQRPEFGRNQRCPAFNCSGAKRMGQAVAAMVPLLVAARLPCHGELRTAVRQARVGHRDAVGAAENAELAGSLTPQGLALAVSAA